MWWMTLALAAPESLTSYEALVAALEGGGEVRAVVHYGQCLLDHKGGPDVVGGLDFDGFESYAKGVIGNPVGFVSTSRTRWTVDPVFGPVQWLVRLKVYDDGRAELDYQYRDRKQKLVLDQTYGCAIGENSGLQLFTGG